jgi:putative PIN family toxin of toxin-antitoxin system
MKTAPHKKLRVVFDTNVLFSMLAFPGGRMDVFLEIILQDQVDLVLSDFILEELGRNIKKKTSLNPKDAIKILRSHSFIHNPTEKIDVIKTHNPDNRILECAVGGHVEVLVTGNMKDIRSLGAFRGVAILSPREFIEKYFPHLAP